MRVKPSPKHAKKIHKVLLEAMGSPYLDIHKPFIKVIASAIRRAYNVKIVFRKELGNYVGFWWGDKRLMELASRRKSMETFCTLCHELVHVYCDDNNMFKQFHNKENKTEADASRGEELYVENMAEQLFHLFFPGQQFYRTIHPGEGNGAKK